MSMSRDGKEWSQGENTRRNYEGTGMDRDEWNGRGRSDESVGRSIVPVG